MGKDRRWHNRELYWGTWFADHEDRFLEVTEQVAGSFGHQVVQTDKHFVSDWVVANPTEYGEDWREF